MPWDIISLLFSSHLAISTSLDMYSSWYICDLPKLETTHKALLCCFVTPLFDALVCAYAYSLLIQTQWLFVSLICLQSSSFWKLVISVLKWPFMVGVSSQSVQRCKSACYVCLLKSFVTWLSSLIQGRGGKIEASSTLALHVLFGI